MSVIKVDVRPLERIQKELPQRTEKVCKKMAFLIERRAKIKAPVDTGALRNSIYTVTKDYDGFVESALKANKGVYGKSGRLTKRKSSKGTSIASISRRTFTPHPKPTGNTFAYIGPSVDYAEFVEFGTGRMAARPFLTPAVEETTADFNNPKYWEAIIA